MILCPCCGSTKTRVADSRQQPCTVHRRRQCFGCDHRWSTFEVSEAAYLALVEFDGLMSKVGTALRQATGIVEEARGEGLLIGHDFDIQGKPRTPRKPIRRRAPASHPVAQR